MSDEEDLEFETKRHKLTKNQQIYGVFNQAYEDERPTLGATHSNFKKKSHSNHGKMMNFKAGEVVNPNNEKVEINIPEGKKKKRVTFSGEQKIHTFQTEPNKPLTMESFLEQIASEEQQVEIQNKQEDKKPQGLSENVKRSLKLYKYSEYHKPKTMADYGLPEEFGKKATVAAPKPQKTAEQIELEREYIKKYGVAYKMLLKSGWKAGQGLGKEKQGIKAPVEAVFKTSLSAQDTQEQEEQTLRPKQPSESEETNQTNIRGFEQLFDYFSQNQEINTFLRDLKNDYEKLTTIIDRQQEQVDKLSSRVSQLQSHILQTQNQQATIKQNLKQLSQIKKDIFNCDKYPHHALKFDVDLLIVKMSYENIEIQSFEQLFQHRQSVFQQLAHMRVKLQKIYLQKQKQNIRNFTKMHIENMLYEKVIDVDGLEEKAQISQEDLNKIAKFIRLLLDQKLLPVLTPKLQKLDLDQHDGSQMLLDVLEMVGRLDGQLVKQLCSQYAVHKLNSHMGKFNVKDKIPLHLVIFPWFTVVNPGQLNFDLFLKRLYLLQWQPEDDVMLNCIKHWQPYMSKQSWSDLVGLCIAPKLLKMMDKFAVSASDGNMKNLNKIKILMQYQQIVDSAYLQAILEDTLIRQVEKTYKNLKVAESAESVSKWLDMWRKTVFRIVGRGSLTDRLDRLCDM